MKLNRLYFLLSSCLCSCLCSYWRTFGTNHGSLSELRPCLGLLRPCLGELRPCLGGCLMGKCAWPGGCWQDQSAECDPYCYYHWKLVEGRIDARVTTTDNTIGSMVKALVDAGAAPGAIARTESTEPKLPYDRHGRRRGSLPEGTIRGLRKKYLP